MFLKYFREGRLHLQSLLALPMFCLFVCFFSFYSVPHSLMKLKSMSSCQCNLAYMQCIGQLILEQIKKEPFSAVLVFPEFINSFFYGQSMMILWFVEKNLTFYLKEITRTLLQHHSHCFFLFNKQCRMRASVYDDIMHLSNDPQP